MQTRTRIPVGVRLLCARWVIYCVWCNLVDRCWRG